MPYRQSKVAVYQVEGLFLILRGQTYYIHGTHSGQRVRRATGTANLHIAKEALDDLYREFESGWRAGEDDTSTPWKAVAKAVHYRHRVSAAARGIPFDVTAAEVFEAMRASGFRCAVSGIAYSRRVAPSGPADPWSPSIDRIENRHGYLRTNVRVVCLAANLAMNRWGYDVLLRLSRAVVEREKLAQNVPTSPVSLVASAA